MQQKAVCKITFCGKTQVNQALQTNLCSANWFAGFDFFPFKSISENFLRNGFYAELIEIF
ncbi:hypothetical protein D0T90_10125 [Neisseria animalis]|uniref:Uncharacterized protein n=1 Tax=Neisseria animalis TaxID=492 RepID=A0A5P3MTC5_NEIAN|nr:hypothetical protein D0T90_10125 [Neisseria animalis]ROW31821.1 hypothetical protein CGZ60_08040 [Neisseria animalis]VEE07735.1 Uncharacterised protein [Neisseria animalis]